MWPETLKPKSRTWVAENIYETTVTNGHFAFRKPADGDAQTYASFEFADTRLRYSRKLPVVEQAHGHAVLEGNRFTAVADGGYLTPPKGGQIDVTGTSFVIPDIRIKPAPAEVSLAASGKLRAALSLLNLPPLSVLDKAGRDLDLASGEVVARGELRMPLRKKLPPDLLRFQVAAVLSDVASTTLVKDRQLRADRLELRADNDRMVITGPGTLEGVPFDAVYESSLKKADRGKAQLTGSIEISNRALDAFNIDLPKGTLRGVGRGQMDVTLQKGRPPEFQLTSDLAGVGLSLPPLYWSLPQSRNGSLTVAGRLSKPAQINTLSLEAAGLRARGALSLRPDGGMKELTLSQLQAGRWLDAKVTLKGRGKGKTPEVLLQGGTVDLRHVPKAGERATQRQASASGAVTPLSGGLDQLRISDSLRLTNLAGQFLAGRGLNGDFTAQVNGQAPVNGTVYSAGSRSAYELRSPDAGAVFKAAGLMKQARGGEMILRLTEVDTPGHYDGELNVTGTRVIEVPVLASLLHAVSVVGLVEQMAAGGILFSNVEARFRLTPDRLILSRASAVGASMGLSIDGYYDLKERQMDFQGVLSPVYMVNGIGSLLTRKGEGLIGFNYLLRGRGDDPRVIVNPLSLFTPGMFREIFRRPPPKVDQ
nr:DUF3971 domain-containing protein [Thalassobius sp. Cn5-15]